MPYSEKLKLNYKIKYTNSGERRVVFEDNVNYSDSEMMKLHGLPEVALRNIHNIKNIFEGVII